MEAEIRINSRYSSEWMKSNWRGNELPKGETRLEMLPYPCGILRDFLQWDRVSDGEEKRNFDLDKFLSGLREEIKALTFNRKENDLMSLSQSSDLKNLDGSAQNDDRYKRINVIREFLSGPVREWMSEVTGISLREDYVALTVSVYNYTDYLLCHDDELEERRVAFVLYLSPDWDLKQGGSLDIFNSTENGEPAEIAHRFYPTENSFSFFEVSSKSFHQVAEVVGSGAERISINGWFHGEPLARPEPNPSKTLVIHKPIFDLHLKDFTSWINPWYLAEENQPEIAKKFERDSQIELLDFLQKEKYESVCDELNAVTGEMVSVPNKRHYKCVTPKPGGTLEKCLRFMRSDSMFLILSQLTGVTFHPLLSRSDTKNGSRESESTEPSTSKKRKLSSEDPDAAPAPQDIASRCSYQYRSFGPGDFTLLHDGDVEPDLDKAGIPLPQSGGKDTFCLDAQLFFTSDNWTPEYGGYTCYVAKDDDEEILTVVPKRNSLALVYRDGETVRFVKYLNHNVNQLSQPGFYDLSMTYFSGYPDEDDDDDEGSNNESASSSDSN